MYGIYTFIHIKTIMEHIIDTTTTKDGPSRGTIWYIAVDLLSLLLRNKVTPCFSSITLHRYADTKGTYPDLSHYTVNSKKISKKAGDKIRALIDLKARNHLSAIAIEDYDEETLFPENITNQATLLEINAIVREARLQAANATSWSEEIK